MFILCVVIRIIIFRKSAPRHFLVKILTIFFQKSENSDRSRPEPQVPHIRVGPLSPVRLRKKSRSPQKSPKLRSRPSGVVYSDNDEAERKESFQITFRKVTAR